MPESCKHTPALHMAAQHLIRHGKIETFDAVYRWTCGLCGAPRRTTRLSDTVYALRHAWGWLIDMTRDSEMLATYTLVKVGDIPGVDNTKPHPRRLVRDGGETKWACAACGTTVPRLEGRTKALLGGYELAHCPTCKRVAAFRLVA